MVAALNRSATSPLLSTSSAPRRQSLGMSLSSSRASSVSRLSMASGSPSVNGGSPNSSFSVRYGQAAVFAAPPRLVAVVETPDVAVGAIDPSKRRLVTATRFSSRAGADRRIFMSTHRDKQQPLNTYTGRDEEDDEDLTAVLTPTVAMPCPTPPPLVDLSTDCIALTGAWAALAEGKGSGGSTLGLFGTLPKDFAGLATPDKNPMSMQLTHEEVVVGCTDGTI
jgi:pyrimidine and pyridine-specific 5'-nucleotidase